MNIYLVRHGEKEKIPGDPDLTKKGIWQAQKTALYFSAFKIDSIIASPLLRTIHTAQIISSAINLKLKIDNNLLERANWEGNIDFKDFNSKWRIDSIKRKSKSTIGDSSIYAGIRIEKIIKTYSKSKKNQNIILVSHGGTITDFLRNIYSDDFLIKIYFQNSENLYNCAVPECSITQLILENNKYKLEKICYTKHLE